MKTKTFVVIGGLFGTLLVVLNACYYDQVIPVEPSIGDVGNVTFAADIIPIFNSSCAISGCHNGTVSPNLLPTNAYTSLTNGGYINVGDPRDSELYKEMKGDDGTPMPPSGSNPSYNAKILKWIELGALNN